ncbi:MAG: sugar phosphate nucleotidyltransferase, partial [Candidatus Omnitrophica bacterium]|nr:sugar phosphate nucleotidyltransferase [Candidatus Omnitrophota bacterium]
FGKDIIPALVRKKANVIAYDFSHNRMPSLKKYEAKYYWKDVGTISSYWESNMDLLGKEPKLDLDNQDWPVYASNLNCPPAYTIGSRIDNSLISEGAKIQNSTIRNSILGRGVTIEEGCVIEDSIILDFCRIEKNSSLKGVIVDRFNTIPEKSKIGYNKESDSRNYYLDSSGIVVVKRGSRKAFYF